MKNNSFDQKIHELESALRNFKDIAIAVSGGVDSLTLATFAHRASGVNAVMYHALSSAVPALASERVQQLAEEENWSLNIINAHEFNRSEYIANPVNRCYYCKSQLYSQIKQYTEARIASGANLDDLDDYRPGLVSAKEHDVFHPYIEAGLSKQDVRSLARKLGLGHIAELPASPCLSSRIQTGISIDANVLTAVDNVETSIHELVNSETVRCRVREHTIEIELDAASLSSVNSDSKQKINTLVEHSFSGLISNVTVCLSEYSMGSAFIQPDKP